MHPAASGLHCRSGVAATELCRRAAPVRRGNGLQPCTQNIEPSTIRRELRPTDRSPPPGSSCSGPCRPACSTRNVDSQAKALAGQGASCQEEPSNPAGADECGAAVFQFGSWRWSLGHDTMELGEGQVGCLRSGRWALAWVGGHNAAQTQLVMGLCSLRGNVSFQNLQRLDPVSLQWHAAATHLPAHPYLLCC